MVIGILEPLICSISFQYLVHRQALRRGKQSRSRVHSDIPALRGIWYVKTAEFLLQDEAFTYPKRQAAIRWLNGHQDDELYKNILLNVLYRWNRITYTPVLPWSGDTFHLATALAVDLARIF